MPMAAPEAMETSRENFGFSGAKTSISLKNSRAARAKDDRFDLVSTIDIVISPTDAKVKNPPK